MLYIQFERRDLILILTFLMPLKKYSFVSFKSFLILFTICYNLYIYFVWYVLRFGLANKRCATDATKNNMSVEE